MVMSIAAGAILWGLIAKEAAQFWREGLPRATAIVLLAAPFLLLAGIVAVLKRWSAPSIRSDAAQIAMYGSLGAAWISAAPALLLPGISLRDDFFERHNASAAWTFIGCMLGSAFCYAGGNIGNGPGWPVVIFSAGLANASLGVLWVMANQLAPLADRITIDRDPGVGLQAAGFLAGSGLILSRAVAGPWVSITATLREFGWRAWPVICLAGILAVTVRCARPQYAGDKPETKLRGIFPAMVQILLGLAWAAA